MDQSRHQEIARCLFRESNDALIIFDPGDDRVLDLNPTALRLTGFDRKAALKMRVTDLFSSADPQGVQLLIDAYRKTGVFHSREDYWLKRLEGTPLPINVSVSRIHTTPEPLGLAVVRDISERRKAQEVLERFFHLSPALFAILTPEGRFLRLNPAWEHVLGYSSDELRPMSALRFLQPDHEGAEARHLEELSGLEVCCRHKDGTERWISWSTTTVNGLTYAVGLDITGAKQALQLRLDKEAAELASQAKGHFLARMSHELRTPLTAILGLLDVFLDDPCFPSIPQDRADDLRTIKRNGEHLLQLINNVLDLSRIEEGKLAPRVAPCRPAAIVSDVVDLLTRQAASRGLSLEVEIEPTAPPVFRTDEVYLRQILLNLLGNAIKFTEQGGVRVRLGVEAEDSSSARLRIDVVDTGVGLTDEAISALFRPFQRVDLMQKRSPGGTGLGLAICRQIAGSLGGTIRVTSRPGVGSTFSLILPGEGFTGSMPAPAPVSEAVPPTAQDGASFAAGRRILLAEDNADNRRAIALRLEQLGFDVLTARDGQEAFDLATEARSRGKSCDVILMDMQMPILDGYEATRRLRTQGYEGAIIALTAYALDEDRAECLQSGCDEHISKPIDWDQLLRLIDGRTLINQ